jgi:hypothetical protein
MQGPISIRAVDCLPTHETLWDNKVRGFGVRRQMRDAFYILKYRANGERKQISSGSSSGTSART